MRNTLINRVKPSSGLGKQIEKETKLAAKNKSDIKNKLEKASGATSKGEKTGKTAVTKMTERQKLDKYMDCVEVQRKKCMEGMSKRMSDTADPVGTTKEDFIWTVSYLKIIN